MPAHTLGVTDPDDADFIAMLQFGESTSRLAVIARQAGHGTEAVNELWPLVTRLESRLADGHVERDVMILLARARGELGVSLGYVLPEERLVSAARWTGPALWLAEHLDDQDLLAFALRVHGNELRKVERAAAAVARLHHSADLVPEADQGAAMVQLARAAGEIGDPARFDLAVDDAWRLVDARPSGRLASPYALHEVHLRGLVRTSPPGLAINLLDRHRTSITAIPPQWQAILHVTTGEVLLARADTSQAETAFRAAIAIAEDHRLPHQIQRTVRACTPQLPAVGELARHALDKLRIASPDAARGQARQRVQPAHTTYPGLDTPRQIGGVGGGGSMPRQVLGKQPGRRQFATMDVPGCPRVITRR